MTAARAALTALLVLAGCTSRPTVRPPVASIAPPSTAQMAAPPSATARSTGAVVVPLPPMRLLGDLSTTLAAFRRGCPTLIKAADPSGLTLPADWVAPCTATATDPAAFFAAHFAGVQIGDGRGLDTGYYEPEIAASRTRAPGYDVPLYRRPPDLIEADLGKFDAGFAGKRVRGRVEGNAFVPYADRAAIMAGAVAGRGLELAWAADPYAAFFLEIQGSGRLRLPDGAEMRIGYDSQNGHAYTAIGKLLRDRGALAPGQATMAGIIGWLRAHPGEAPAVLAANRSVVFFRDTTGKPGPVGSMGVPLTPEVSVAADPAFVPPGAPLWLTTLLPGGGAFAQVVVAQDRGGAIKGANRLDIFFGHGERAAALAGAMAATGSVTLLLPNAAAARLTSDGAPVDAASPRR